MAEALARARRCEEVDLGLSNHVEGLETEDGVVIGVRAGGESVRPGALC